jgi:hypothetical protein
MRCDCTVVSRIERIDNIVMLSRSETSPGEAAAGYRDACARNEALRAEILRLRPLNDGLLSERIEDTINRTSHE